MTDPLLLLYAAIALLMTPLCIQALAYRFGRLPPDRETDPGGYRRWFRRNEALAIAALVGLVTALVLCILFAIGILCFAGIDAYQHNGERRDECEERCEPLEPHRSGHKCYCEAPS